MPARRSRTCAGDAHRQIIARRTCPDTCDNLLPAGELLREELTGGGHSKTVGGSRHRQHAHRVSFRGHLAVLDQQVVEELAHLGIVLEGSEYPLFGLEIPGVEVMDA